MKLLELFSGTASISEVFREEGHEVFTVDNDPRFNSDLCIDIMNLTAEIILERFGRPDVIWASPPCQCFSVASISTHWTGGKKAYVPKTEAARISIQLIDKVEELIRELRPKYWFIENPRGVMRKMNKMIALPRTTVTYCMYGDIRMKPTDIWHNCHNWNPRPVCKNGDPCHESAPRGSKTGTQGLKNSIDRGRVPPDLCREIMYACEKE